MLHWLRDCTARADMRGFVWFLTAATLLLGACARLPDTGVTEFKTQSLPKLQSHVLDRPAALDEFRARGPFEVNVEENVFLQTTAHESVEADLYLAAHTDPAPLVVLLHGYGNSKDDHAYQAYHLATWGLHSATVQLPSDGSWVENGAILARLATSLARRAEVGGKRIDPRKIVLVGHSFGGSAVAIALAQGAPSAGGILLDPAGIGRELTGYLKKIRRPPVMVLASDQRINIMRQREEFYQYIAGEVAEISVVNAHHEDATFPMEHGWFDDSPATEELQITFVSALTAAALSLAFTGKLDYAWAAYVEGMKSGRLYDPLRR